MKKFFKIVIYIFAFIVLLLAVGYFYMTSKHPDVSAAPDLKINPTPEMIERGRYLAYGFAVCMDCHSERDVSKYPAPLIAGTEGKGGADFGEGAGEIFAKNITSDKETGLGSWTDGEIFRAITMGVDKDGEPLAPMMPYQYFRNMDENDIKAIIAFIRTLKPIRNEISKHKLNFPLNIIFRTIPSAPDFKKLPDKSNTIELGKYYSGACLACHSPMVKGEFIQDKLFSGGVEFPAPTGGVVRSANISPDKETGIGNWTKEQFIKKFKSFNSPENFTNVKQGELNTVMPWTFFATCTEEDLGAVYDYLMTQQPQKNTVEKYSANATVTGNN